MHNKIIGVLLFLIIIISLSMFPLSKAIDGEINTISTTAELKRLTDKLIIAIIKQSEEEREFFLTRSETSTQNIEKFSDEINQISQSLAAISNTQPNWNQWFQKINGAIIEHDQYLKDLIAVRHTFSQNIMTSLNETVKDGLSSNSIIKSILSFVFDEELLLNFNYERLILLRTTLNYVVISAILLTFLLTYFFNKKLRHNLRQLKSNHDQLSEENTWLESHVRERTVELEEATKYAQKERQRAEFLLQDASHRIGNSLATASSLLSLQINQSQNNDVKSALALARDHIQTIATAHRRLRLSEDMDTTDSKEFLETVIKDMQMQLPEQKRDYINIKTNIENHKLGARDATTLAIITGELMTNAVKHAFTPNTPAHININLTKDDNGLLKLIVENDGKRFVANTSTNKGLGHLIINKLCMQFDSAPIFENIASGGTRVTLPLNNLTPQSTKVFSLK